MEINEIEFLKILDCLEKSGALADGSSSACIKFKNLDIFTLKKGVPKHASNIYSQKTTLTNK